jgi:hypothetical protein
MAEHMGNMADDILPSPQRSGAVVPSIRVFDVNETLLDTLPRFAWWRRMCGIRSERKSIGCSAALITRPGNAMLPVHGLPQPQAVAADLPDLAMQLINLWR